MNNSFIEYFMNISSMIIHELFILKGRIMNYLIIHEFVNLDKAGRLLIFSSFSTIIWILVGLFNSSE